MPLREGNAMNQMKDEEEKAPHCERANHLNRLIREIRSGTAFRIVFGMVQGRPDDRNVRVVATCEFFCKEPHIYQFLRHWNLSIRRGDQLQKEFGDEIEGMWR